MASTQAQYYTDQLFDKTPFPGKAHQETIFENCTFKNCDLSGINFSGSDFIDCLFDTCNFSTAKFANTGLKNASFKGCKLSGVNLGSCNDFLFAANFEDCILDYASLHKKKNKKCSFINCSMKSTDLTEADLTEAIFQNCDLQNAEFGRTILTGANLTTASNFTIDPEQNQMRKARFSQQGLIGLLGKYGIIVEY
ncbi:pentapeptide repeat protein [Mucilaginibacter gracilis]|uniref:Pentapeptide repeat protein n=1 Tax=Mucilaginibacter gracilis TaxID=423350 RepID=A0A495IVL3_9SPHI|nr:pentapeptide repeat-containing protein [Mucilaginibacter gracilis]RKR80038.1 pentapeptide repeat protein [Mucilaginibacter gracilis]